MNALPTRRRFHWHPASVVAASTVWMICSGLNPVPLAAVDAPTVGWRSDSLKTTDSWNTLTLEMTVKRKHIGQNGETIGAPSPDAAYRIERSRRSGAWKTVITVLSINRGPIHSLNGLIGSPSPFPIARLEDDEDGSPIRAYDSFGRQLTIPLMSAVATDAALAPTRHTGNAWIEAFVATGAAKTARLQRLERKYGKATKVNGLSRYLLKTIDSSEELLVNAKTIVPVQDTMVKNTRLLARRTYTYSPAYTDAFVRTAVHSETAIASTSTERAVVDTVFSNIKLERR